MANPIEKTESQPVNVDVLAEHYQKTYEVAYEYSKERNKLFVFLVLTAVFGLMLILHIPTSDSLLVAAIAKFLNITDQITRADLQAQFPFDILLSGVLVVMFYLMQRLYSTNLSVMRTYLYLGALEKEFQPHLGLAKGSVSFTREGGFYWGKRTAMQAMSKYYYVVVLFIVLIPFIAFKLFADSQSPNLIIIAVDVIVSLMVILYWREYVLSSFHLDVPKLKPEKETSTDKKS